LLLAWEAISAGECGGCFFGETGCRGVVAEAFPGAFVEFAHDVVDVCLGVAGEVAAFGEVLADEAVVVLVSASLPQWPASSLVSADAGRWSIIVLLVIVGP
jgi:hypothetical protein